MGRDTGGSRFRVSRIDWDAVTVAVIIVICGEESLAPEVSAAAVDVAGPGRCVRNQAEIVSAAVVACSLERSAAPHAPVSSPIFHTAAADSLPVICTAEHGGIASEPVPDVVVVAADRI